MGTGVIKNQVRGKALAVSLPCISVQYLTEETERYRLAIENYARACKAAEDEEYEIPEDGDWER